ncbi:MAG TPA: hypothetical protein VMV92_01120 [Streptosporangiaceae bacterium]|nr:hypothetical protein [Streptosporangiaceae bacterium]
MAGGGLWLAGMTAGVGYSTGVLPGLVLLGLGIGLVFPAATVSAMSNVTAGREGLASGMMTTAHEVGAALGVAVFPAVAAAGQAAAVGPAPTGQPLTRQAANQAPDRGSGGWKHRPRIIAGRPPSATSGRSSTRSRTCSGGAAR